MEFKITKANIRANFDIYKVYLFATTIILSIFSAFLNFTSDQVILEKISESGRVEMMAKTIYVFLLLFLTFFLTYFNHFFLKNRSREIGILALLGFSKKKLIKILCYENLFVLASSYLLSILIGSGIYFGISKSIVALLNLDIITPWSMNFGVVAKTFVVGMMIFAINAVINTFLIRKWSLLEFVHYSKKEERPVRVKKIMGVLAFLLLFAGYVLALLSYFGIKGVWGIGVMPVFGIMALCIAGGSFLTMKFGLVYALYLKKKNKEKLYTPIGNIIYPKLSFRIATKNKLLISMGALLTLTVTILGIMTITLVYPLKAIDRLTPSAIEYKTTDNSKNEIQLDHISEKYGAKILNIPMLRVKTTPNIPITENATKTLGYFDVVKYSDYYELMKNQGREEFTIKNVSELPLLLNYYPTEKPLGMKFMVLNKEITIHGLSTKNIFSFSTSVTTLVVEDSFFNELLKAKDVEIIHLTTLNGEDLRDSKEFYLEFEEIEDVKSSYDKKYTIVRDNASTFIFISFIAVLLVICTTSILYFTNLVEIMENKKEYDSMKKIGYSDYQISCILAKEIAMLYKIPICIGILNGGFIMFAFRFIFIDNLIGSKGLFFTSFISMTVFLVIYCIFYYVTKKVAKKLLNIK